MTVSTVCDDFPTLTGRQEPHHLSMFAGDVTHGERSVELSRRAGASTMPWQRAAQHAILSTNEVGRWVHPTCCIIVPRQNGKSEILIRRCLYGLYKLGETIIYTAQRWKTARDAWKRLMALIRSRPWLRKHVVRSTCSQGEGIVELASGAIISFGTRSNDTGRGLTVVDLIVYDEAYNLTDGEISAMSFTQLASKNAQRIYASSAVNQDEHVNGAVLAAVRARGLAAEKRLYFAEFMAPDGSCECIACVALGSLDRDDPATVRYANPSFGVVQTDEDLADIKANMTTKAGRKAFDVEALGRGDWPKDETEIQTVIDMDLWGAMAESNPRVRGQIAIAVDMTADRKWVTIAAATRTIDDRIRLEVGYHATPTPAVTDKILSLIAKWDPCCLVINGGSPAASLVPELAKSGIEPEVTSSAQMMQACGGFYDDALAGTLSHAEDPRLTEALAGVKKKSMGSDGAFGWDYKSDVILSPLQAATLARWGLLTFGLAVKKPPASPSTGTRISQPQSRSRNSEFDVLTAAF